MSWTAAAADLPKRRSGPMLGAFLAELLAASCALAQPGPQTAEPQATALTQPASEARDGAAAALSAKSAGTSTAYLPNRFAGRAGIFYRAVWGIDSPVVRLAESGEMVRFSYRVVDPDKAVALNDKSNEPSLIDPQAGVSLVVPTMEKVGPLRQSITPQSGRSYWMAFSNKGRLVKKGDRVDVVIGPFRATNLVVD
jgi:hypothetical protein